MSGEIWSDRLSDISGSNNIPFLKLLIGRKIKIDGNSGYFVPSEVIEKPDSGEPMVIGKGYRGMNDNNGGGPYKLKDGRKVQGWNPTGLRIEIVPDGAEPVPVVVENALDYLYK